MAHSTIAVFRMGLPRGAFAWCASQDLPWPRSRECAVVHHRNPVDDDPRDAFRIVVRVRIRADIASLLGAEDGYVRDTAFTKATVIGEAKARCRHGRHLAHRLLQGEHLLLADIPA